MNLNRNQQGRMGGAQRNPSELMGYGLTASTHPAACRQNGKFTMKRQPGFTIFEMVIVIIMLGILTAGLAPLLLRQHNSTMEERDRTALDAAKTAIVSYATSFGGIPDPLDFAGPSAALGPARASCADPATTAIPARVGLMPWSAQPFPNDTNPAVAACANNVISALGVNNWGAFGKENPFRMDVNGDLRSSTINAIATASSSGQRVVFCQSVNKLMSEAGNPFFNMVPRVCQDSADHVATPCPPSSSSPTAFVIYSTGNDRAPNQQNGFTASRVYENDNRGINNSPGNEHYDDQVMSYPLTALARDCRERMNVLPEVMSCKPGQKAVVVTNTSGQTSYYNSAGNILITDNISCRQIADQAVDSANCQDTAASVSVFSTPGCLGAADDSKTINTVTTNSDGKINAVIGASGVAATITLY